MTTNYEFQWVTLEETWTQHEQNKGGFRLSWGCKGMSPVDLAWGTITFYRDHGGQLHCDNERMDQDFVQQALLFFVASATFQE